MEQARAFPRWETSALPGAWVNRVEKCIAGQRRGGREKGALREGAEEICEVLAVCVRPGRVVCEP